MTAAAGDEAASRSLCLDCCCHFQWFTNGCLRPTFYCFLVLQDTKAARDAADAAAREAKAREHKEVMSSPQVSCLATLLAAPGRGTSPTQVLS